MRADLRFHYCHPGSTMLPPALAPASERRVTLEPDQHDEWLRRDRLRTVLLAVPETFLKR
jgi:hypothetical protein